ncbi:hypothetical protein ACEQ8H_007564 [Pleosporales sp. CAS-2024a]
MPTNWSDKAVQDRLLMAIIASVDNKINVGEVARLYGGDMTYHAVETYLRKFRKEAKEMKGSAAVAPSPSKPRPRKSVKSSPVKEVKSGRVSKKAPAPTKVKVKAEMVEEEMKSILGGEGEEVELGEEDEDEDEDEDEVEV